MIVGWLILVVVTVPVPLDLLGDDAPDLLGQRLVDALHRLEGTARVDHDDSERAIKWHISLDQTCQINKGLNVLNSCLFSDFICFSKHVIKLGVCI